MKVVHSDGGYIGVDLDFEHLPTGNASVTRAYSTFLRALAVALHAAGKKLSTCVGTYPTASDGVDVFYDPAAINETCDVIRVMNYDMYWVGGRGVPSLAGRPDCVGAGPTSTQPWARQSMEWWAARVSPPSKLVMGLSLPTATTTVACLTLVAATVRRSIDRGTGGPG